MNLNDFYKKIISEEAYSNLEVFFLESDTFEEIPIISRQSRVLMIQEMMHQDDVSEFLLGLACFVLNTIKIMARVKGVKFGLAALTFRDFDIEEYGTSLLPNLFIYPDQEGLEFRARLERKQLKIESAEMARTKKVFESCGVINQFTFLESRFFDSACGEELVTIFAILKYD